MGPTDARRRTADMALHPANPNSEECRRVLGVDPASAGPTGYGIIECNGKVRRVLRYGALEVGAKQRQISGGVVLREVHQLLCALIEEFKPQAVAVESVFTALNMRTALKLAEVRGVVLLAAEQHGIEVRSYSPREVKACVAGYGHADKRQMQLMVRAQLGMKELPEPSDAADALAVALCYLEADRMEKRFGLQRESETARAKPRSRNQVNGAKHATPVSGARIQPNR
jgi:crossover junction endodeoxyribonuclease RuvC